MRSYKNDTEHFLIIPPSEPVSTFITEKKKEISQLLGYNFRSRYSIPHISILMGLRPKDYSYTVEDSLRFITPFELTIKDFGVFHHGPWFRTIYAEIVNKSGVYEIKEALGGGIKNFTPHLTIARKLPIEDFKKVWPLIQNISYSNHFVCDHLTILQRNKSYRWEKEEEIRFGR